MTVEALIPVLFWIVVVSLVALFALRGLGRKYPGTALAPFRSRHDVGQYFALARHVIALDNRLIRYPMYLTILNYAVYLPGWLIVRTRVLETYGSLPPRFALGFPIVPITVSGLVSEFLGSARWLAYGYFGFLAGSLAVLVLSAAAVLACGRFTKGLQRRTGVEHPGGLGFLERILKVLRQMLLATAVLLTVAFIRGLPQFAFAFSLAAALVLSVAWLLIATLIEGVILYYASDRIAGEESEYGNLLKRSLSVLKPLFKLNIVISVGLMLGALIAFPFSLQTGVYSLLGAGPPPSPSVPFWLAVRVANYFSPVFAALTVFAPFFIIRGASSAGEALRANFVLLGRHWLKYVTMVAVAMCVLLETVVLRMTVVDFVARFGLALLSVGLAVLIFPALLNFHKDYTRA
jgi:hypothetical protein